MAESNKDLALKCSSEANFTPSVKTCERTSGYKVSIAYYMGAMGLSMPTRSANQSEPKKRPTPRRLESPQQRDEVIEPMVQLELDLGEVRDV